MLSMITTYFDVVRKIAISLFTSDTETGEEVTRAKKRHLEVEDDDVGGQRAKIRRNEQENHLWHTNRTDHFLLPLNEIPFSNRIKARPSLETPSLYKNKKHSLSMASSRRKENIINVEDEEDNDQIDMKEAEIVAVEKHPIKMVPRRDSEDIQVLKIVAPRTKHPRSIVIASKPTQDREIHLVPTKTKMEANGSSSSNCTPSHSYMSHYFINPRSSFIRKQKLLEESIRLEEKKKYSELLQSYTKVPVSSPKFSQTQCSRSPPLSLLNASKKKCNNQVEVIDLTSQFEDMDRNVRSLQREREKLIAESGNSSDDYSWDTKYRCLKDKKSYLETHSPLKSSSKSVNDVDACSLRSRSPTDIAGRMNKMTQKKGRPTELVDLTVPEGSRKNKTMEYMKDDSKVISLVDDDEIGDGFTTGKKTDDSPPTDSAALRQKLETCPVYDISWTSNIIQMYKEKEKEMRRRVNEEQLKAALKRSESDEMMHQILEERMRRHMRITEVAVEEGPIPIAEDEEKLPELTSEMEKMVSAAFRDGPPGEVLVEAFSQRIARRDIHKLAGTNWLNDEVINFYMNLLMERGKLDNYPSVYCFNTFFYPKLAQCGHGSLKRWTRKIDVFAHDILIVPVHLGVHWCLACVRFPEKKILYYDSMGGANTACLQVLLRYLQEESMDKKKRTFDTTGWKTENVKNNPQQMNGSDCGMFTCMYAEYICRGAKITFSQKDMPYFRRKMAYEILTKKLLL